jgi:pyruvate,water dikinase
MGLPVPPGFLLTTTAYRRFVEANDIQAAIIGFAGDATDDDPAALARASTAIQALFEAAVLPEEVATAIDQAYADLGGTEPAVAVRSSATAEDLPALSFAGQHETYLNVRDATALLEAVRRCWASLWTAQAMGYRARMGIDPQAVAMGVVVQTMVAAEVAGVLFTANPTTGERSELVVNASYGLGEAIVAGRVTPDTYVLERVSLAPKETTIGAKETMIVPAGGRGTVTQKVPEPQRGQPALPVPLLRELAALGVYVEQYLGGVPLDIEWAIAQGRCWILQSRPITSLPPAPLRDVRWEPPPPGIPLVRRQVTEHMPEPLSPLFDELYLQEGLDQSIDAFLAFLGNSRPLEQFVDEYIERPFFVTVNGYAYSRVGIDFHWKLIPLILQVYVTALPTLLRRWLPYWRDEALPAYRATIERWKGLDLAGAAHEQLLQGVRELAVADARYWFAAALPLGVARTTDTLLNRFLTSAVAGRRPTTGQRGESVEPSGGRLASALFLRGLPSKAMEAQAALESMARHAQDSEVLRELIVATPAHRLLDALASFPAARPLLDDIQRYLDLYGHQVYTLDFAVPTLAEDPLPVLMSLTALVQNPEKDGRAQQVELARARQLLEEATAQSLDPLRRWLFRQLLGWAQRFAPYREEALFYVGAAWPTLRRLALALGRRLVEAGSLSTPDDVFYLESRELVQACAARTAGQDRPDFSGLARERRELREARKRLHPPAAVPPNYRLKIGPIDLTLFEPQAHVLDQGATLRGFAVSPGRVTAPTSVIRSPADFAKLEPGTILVCPTTTPAWTPLFGQVAGLVTDIGGILAHGSIVAREYGIPAVMGTGNATQRITAGMQVTVDGDNGTVTIVE